MELVYNFFQLDPNLYGELLKTVWEGGSQR